MSEHNEQVAFIDYCNLRANQDIRYGLIFAIPNGGKRHKVTAVKLKREGVKAGVPDLFLPVATEHHHGLFVEMKYGKNSTTDNQKKWIEQLRLQGYAVEVARGFEPAKEIIDSYLAGRSFPPF